MLDRSKLDPTLDKWLSSVNKNPHFPENSTDTLTPEAMREALAKMTGNYVTRVPDVASVVDSVFVDAQFSVALRIYDPAPDRTTPVIVFVHGGGHMCGSVDVYDAICRKLAIEAQQIVVSVDYSLAPEHPYPTALNECAAVIRGLWSHLDAVGVLYQPQLSLVGDSGGGALSATLSAKSQNDSSLPIQKQALIYPSLDYSLSSHSIETLSKGFLLEKDRIEWYFNHYLQNGENTAEISPLFLPVSASMPNTLVITAGFCPLSGEGKRYVSCLREADAMVEHHDEPGQIHAYLNLENLTSEACERTYKKIAEFLNANVI